MAKNWEASERYAKANKVRYTLKVNRKTEADILEMLEKQTNVMGYIKSLIRKDIGSPSTVEDKEGE